MTSLPIVEFPIVRIGVWGVLAGSTRVAPAARVNQTIANQDKKVDDNHDHQDSTGNYNPFTNCMWDVQLEIEKAHP